MYAIIECGGKQYRVQEGDRLRVEKLAVEVGASVTLDRVLLLGGEQTKVGKPLVAGAAVIAKALGQDKEKKILVFHYKAKKNIRKKYGHRQPFTLLLIEKIIASGAPAPVAKSKSAAVYVKPLHPAKRAKLANAGKPVPKPAAKVAAPVKPQAVPVKPTAPVAVKAPVKAAAPVAKAVPVKAAAPKAAAVKPVATKPVAPAAVKPAVKPAVKAPVKAAPKAAVKPAAKAAAKPATKPATKPAVKPATTAKAAAPKKTTASKATKPATKK